MLFDGRVVDGLGYSTSCHKPGEHFTHIAFPVSCTRRPRLATVLQVYRALSYATDGALRSFSLRCRWWCALDCLFKGVSTQAHQSLGMGYRGRRASLRAWHFDNKSHFLSALDVRNTNEEAIAIKIRWWNWTFQGTRLSIRLQIVNN